MGITHAIHWMKRPIYTRCEDIQSTIKSDTKAAHQPPPLPRKNDKLLLTFFA